MFKKIAEYKLTLDDIVALNTPFFRDGIIKTQDLKIDVDNLKIAVAESKLAQDRDKTVEFDLVAELKKYPDSLFVKCFAIKADEENDNGDYFPKDELIKATRTFVGVPIFTNHQNTDINQARGKVIHSWWDEGKNGIMIIARVDAAAYPQLARGITQNYVIGTSMGAKVKYSLCSICHNFAENPTQYCSHIKEQKTRMFNGKAKCAYKKNGTDEVCPICKEKEKSLVYAESKRVFEYNYGVEFIENSFVTSPACHDCGVTEVIDPQRFIAKVAEISQKLPRLIKEAQNTPIMCTDRSCSRLINEDQIVVLNGAMDLLKEGADYVAKLSGVDFLKNNCKHLMKSAGQKEIEDLNQALDLITSVSQAMLAQKEQLDLEFLSDLVSVLSDLQSVTDELTEQGYGRLQSPAPGGQQPETAQPAQQPAEQPQPVATNSTPAGAATSAVGPLASRALDMKKLAQSLLYVKKGRPHQTLQKTASMIRKNLSFKFSIPNQ